MSVEACADIVKRGDPDRFLAAMTADPARRRILFPLYAFNVEVARAPWLTSEPMIAEMRLQWWRDVLEEIQAGANVRRHEVVTPLAEVLDKEAAEALDANVAARRWDIYKDPFEDDAHFKDYIISTSGVLLEQAVRLTCDSAPKAELEAARAVGYAQGLANWFLAIPELEARKRIPLVDGRPPAISELAQGGLDELSKARAYGSQKASAAVLRSAWRSRTILQQVVEAPERVAECSLGTSEFARKFSLLWLSLRNRW